jgi:hypothetical protein
MSSPLLVDWTRSHLSSLFSPDQTASNGDAFAAAFDATFTSSAVLHIATASVSEGTEETTALVPVDISNIVPGEGDDAKQVSGADAIAALRQIAQGVTTVELKDLRRTSGDGEESGVVEGLAELTHSLPFRIRVGPAQTLTNVKFSAQYVLIHSLSSWLVLTCHASAVYHRRPHPHHPPTATQDVSPRTLIPSKHTGSLLSSRSLVVPSWVAEACVICP